MRKATLILLGAISLAFGPATARLNAGDMPAINTPPSSEWYPGKFVWADLFTSDPEAAVRFYTGLFGWTSTRLERHGRTYNVLSLDGRPICGIALQPQRVKNASSDEGMKNPSRGRWVGFVSVPDVANTVAKFTAAGGKVIYPTHDVPDRGTQAVLADGEGALIAVVRSSSGDPGEYQAEPGEWVWEQLFADNTDSASAFYHNALGYEVVPDNQVNGEASFLFTSGGYSRASLTAVPKRPNAHPAWLSYVRVANVDDTVAKATSLGGRLIVKPESSVPDGRMAILADPVGAAFGVVEMADSNSPAPAAPAP